VIDLADPDGLRRLGITQRLKRIRALWTQEPEKLNGDFELDPPSAEAPEVRPEADLSTRDRAR
jgi:hypothetical protein